jgi:diguanylate cyclase (GGDEF)-like protein
MGKSNKQMLDALSRIAGMGAEHFALLSAYGARLFLRRDALVQDLYWYLARHFDGVLSLDEMPHHAELMLAALEKMLQSAPDHEKKTSSVQAQLAGWRSAEQSPALHSGLAECLTQLMLQEIAAQELGPMIKHALAEAVRKRMLLDWMLHAQHRPEADANASGARMYATLSAVSLALLHGGDREHLFQSICNICIERGGFSHAWIGWINPAARSIEPLSMSGEHAAEFIPTIQINLDQPGPSARAVATQEPQVVNDSDGDSSLQRWSDIMRHERIRSMLVTPLMLRGQVVGTLVLYAQQLAYFDQDIVGLVATMAGEIGHALERHDALDRSQKAETELAYLTQHDPLTGLPNRQLMLEHIRQSIERTAENSRLSVVTLAIDGFHELNARLGHASGDVVLREVALRMSQAVLPAGSVGRVGAARFVACLSRSEPIDRLVALLMAAMREPIVCQDEAVSLKCSIGVVQELAQDADATTLMRCSDLALIRARDAGGGRCRFYDESMDEELHRLHALRSTFALALQQGELELFYQPKIDLKDRKFSGVEALVRWRRDGVVMVPGEFFSAIEHTDLMRELDWWVMAEALRHSSVWMAQGKLIPVSVNLSSVTLRHESFLPRLQALIMRHPIPDGHLELEVLETVSLKNAADIIYKLERCREFGVSIALDDFGTGASSLVHLQQLPFDTIKIDQRFVRKLLKAPGNEAIIRSMVSFAHYTGRKLVVEGVESQPIWDRLLEIGCSSGQGYAISPPVPAVQLIPWISAHELSCQPSATVTLLRSA